MNKVLIGPSDVTKQALLHICFVKSEVASVNVRSLDGNAREGCVQFPCPLWVKSRHVQCTNPCPLSANSGHCASHSKTSSARPINVLGTVMPSVLAVFRLMDSSTFAACWTGSSAGLSPLRIRPV